MITVAIVAGLAGGAIVLMSFIIVMTLWIRYLQVKAEIKYGRQYGQMLHDAAERVAATRDHMAAWQDGKDDHGGQG